MKMREDIDLTAKKFGDWLVLKRGNLKPQKNKNKIYYSKTWLCECHCGFCDNTIREVLERNLINDISRGCGRKSKVLNGRNNRKQNEFKKVDDYYEIYCGDKVALVDEDDFDNVIKYKWNLHKDSVNTYFRAYKGYKDNGIKEYIFLHNLIMNNLNKQFIVDHIDGNTLNNKKENLRKCSLHKNEVNKKKPKNNTSGHKGVHYSSVERKWKAYISYKNKRIHLGTFINKEDAIRAREKAENKYFKEFNRGGLNE